MPVDKRQACALGIVTLTGLGGVGKTPMVMAVAGRNVDRFPDGTWWVDLSLVRDPASVGTVFCSAMGADRR